MSCAELIARTFAVRTSAHIAHLKSRSYAEHVALDGFYNGVIDLVDKFAEVHQGLFNLIEDYPEIAPPSGAPLAFLVDYHDWVKENREKCAEGCTALENIVDEISALTARTIYKLRFLK